MQKWALRAITCSKYNAHVDPLFKRLNILKVSDIYKLNALKFYYKYSKNQLPKSFHGFFTPITSNHTYETRNRNTPRYPVPKSVLAKSTIRFKIPELVSNMPTCITDKIYTHSIQGFSQYAKKYFIGHYQDTCNINGCYICNRQWSRPNPFMPSLLKSLNLIMWRSSKTTFRSLYLFSLFPMVFIIPITSLACSLNTFFA